MMSKQNFITILAIIFSVLFLFVSPVLWKEVLNDYNNNPFIQEEEALVTKNKEKYSTLPMQDSPKIMVIGNTANSLQKKKIKEWCSYRTYSYEEAVDIKKARKTMKQVGENKYLCLIDGKFLEKKTVKKVRKLKRILGNGGRIIFTSLPSYQTIEMNEELQDLLGIQYIRAERVALEKIKIYRGFLLGGESTYEVAGNRKTDLATEIPWYDISTGSTKCYMSGLVSKREYKIKNEDMPAIIWSNHKINGTVFAVNGDYMKDETAMGILDSMLYQLLDYQLYSVVNAQNFVIANFPDISNEREEQIQEIYQCSKKKLCRDILWPSLIKAKKRGKWTMTGMLTLKQDATSKSIPSKEDIIEYLKLFHEEASEMGLSIGRRNDSDLLNALKEDQEYLNQASTKYPFTSAYIQKNQRRNMKKVLNYFGSVHVLSTLRTVVTQRDSSRKILNWFSDKVTIQNGTLDAFSYSDFDSLRLRSMETSLGYATTIADFDKIFSPVSMKDTWDELKENFFANLDSIWKPFSAYEKTALTQSDARVRNFLNGTLVSQRKANQIKLTRKHVNGNSFALLRLHDEKIADIRGGSFQKVEDGSYLICLEKNRVIIKIKDKEPLYYEQRSKKN